MAAAAENDTRPTRVAKKRAAAAINEQLRPAAKKKRVVLGDLTNTVATSEKKHSPQKKKIPEEPLAAPENPNDPQQCGPYDSDIYEYLRGMEVDPRKRASADYIENVQTEIDAKMRGVLVDWMVEVAEIYSLVSDTLYLCVAYVDRFLTFNALPKERFQLLGVAAMLVASKYEDKAPEIEKFCYITDYTYSKEEVVNMEVDILKSLKYELGGPTVNTFLRRFSRVGQEGVGTSDLQFEYLSCYLAELTLLDYYCVKFLPSLVAASAVFLARFLFNTKTHPWNLALHILTGYKPADLKECVLNIHSLYLSKRGGDLQAVREKYKHHKFKCVATTPSPLTIPSSFLKFRGTGS